MTTERNENKFQSIEDLDEAIIRRKLKLPAWAGNPSSYTPEELEALKQLKQPRPLSEKKNIHTYLG